MDFIEFCQNEKAKLINEQHSKIIYDLCIALNNCDDCMDCEHQYTINCDNTKIMNQLDLSKVTKTSFRIDGGYDVTMNRKFISLAKTHGYKLSFIKVITNDNEELLQFEKINNNPRTVVLPKGDLITKACCTTAGYTVIEHNLNIKPQTDEPIVDSIKPIYSYNLHDGDKIYAVAFDVETDGDNFGLNTILEKQIMTPILGVIKQDEFYEKSFVPMNNYGQQFMPLAEKADKLIYAKTNAEAIALFNQMVKEKEDRLLHKIKLVHNYLID